MKLDIQQLVDDCGGAAALSEALGISRTTPYRWVAQGMMSSRIIERILEIEPQINIDNYFKGESTNVTRVTDNRCGD